MHFFTGDFCTCPNCSLETQIYLITLRRVKFLVNFQSLSFSRPLSIGHHLLNSICFSCVLGLSVFSFMPQLGRFGVGWEGKAEIKGS